MGYNDIFQIIDRSTLSGQQVLNVYFYWDNFVGSTRDSSDLLDAFEGQMLPAVTAFQTPALLHTQLECNNLFVPADREVRTISVPGEIGGGDDLPNFNALGVALTQDNGAVKNGAKRIGGIADSAQANGVWSGSGYLTLFNALADQLAAPLLDGIIEAWLPVIVKRLLVSPGVYELPTSIGDAVFGVVTEAAWNPLVTSQTSRKIGVGV